MEVTVVGAGGHVGLPLSLVIADAGHKVHGVDINADIVEKLNNWEVPYIEQGAEELLRKHTSPTNRMFTTNPACIGDSDVVAIMLGTPVDEENNPRLDDLFDFVDTVLVKFIKQGQLIILRSTVAPGTTEVIRDRIEAKTSLKESIDFFLVFCPERVLQTKGIEETKNLPQLIGAFSQRSYDQAYFFFKTFVDNNLFFLSPREAEIAKLMTNMWRYINFAFANEMWMIAEKQNVNIHKVIRAANYNYDRMNMPLPGPNVGGPCLFKDGRFLLADVPYVDMIQTSFIINEGMPDYIFNKIYSMNPFIKKVLILGAAFKANCDDTRNSLSFKMKKVCQKHGVDVDIWDPLVTGFDKAGHPQAYDAVIVMTPHDNFKSMKVGVLRNDCIMADVWKFFEESKSSNTGIYKIGNLYE